MDLFLPAPTYLQIMKIHDETDQELNPGARRRRCKAAESTFQDQQAQDMNCKACGQDKSFSGILQQVRKQMIAIVRMLLMGCNQK